MSFIIVQKLWNYCNVLRYNAMTYDNYPFGSAQHGSEQVT